MEVCHSKCFSAVVLRFRFLRGRQAARVFRTVESEYSPLQRYVPKLARLQCRYQHLKTQLKRGDLVVFHEADQDSVVTGDGA